MADAIDQAIALLESERAQIDNALEALRRIRHSRDVSRPDEEEGGSGSRSTPLSEEDTNEEAIDTVLRLTGGGLKTSEIVEQSAKMGKEVKKNSVRWTLHHGVEEDKYVKEKEEGGRANLYWLAEQR